MPIKEHVTGLQHIGLPTKNMDLTLKFYRELGFEEVFSILNGERRVVFIRQKGIVVEVYEQNNTAEIPGAIDHLALNVTNIEKIFDDVKGLEYEILDDEIQFLPFWKHGVKFFTIMGPNGEKIEFSEMLTQEISK